MKFSDLRKAKNLTQDELAKMLNVKRSTLSMWESKKSKPKIKVIENMSKVLQISIEELIKYFN